MQLNVPRLLIIELTILVTGVLAFYALSLVSAFAELFLILAFSLLLTYALLPAVNRLAGVKYISRGLALLIAYLLMLALVAGFVTAISLPLAAQLEQLADSYTRYIDQLQSLVPQVEGWLQQRSIMVDLQAQVEQATQSVREAFGQIVTRTGSILVGFFGTLSSVFFVLFVAAYFLHSGRKFSDEIVKLFPRRRQRLVRRLLNEYDRVLGHFVRGQLLIALVVAVIVGLFTTLIGLPYSVILGIVAGLTAVIPVIGAFLGIIGPVIIAAFVNPILIPVFLVFFVVLNEVTDKYLYPRIVGRAVELHPLIVLFGLLVGLQVAGVAGAILATPVAALIKVTLKVLSNSVGYGSGSRSSQS